MSDEDEAVREIVSRKWSEVGVPVGVLGISQLTCDTLAIQNAKIRWKPELIPSFWNATVFRSSGTEKNVRTFVKNDDLAD
jgi:hypothetical protein